MFLTESDFLKNFKTIKMTRNEFIKKFTVMYKIPRTFETIFDLTSTIKPIVRGTKDYRYINKEKIIDYFYDLIVRQRTKYLKAHYKAYLTKPSPLDIDWLKSDVIIPRVIDDHYVISMQRNDSGRRIVRNLYYKEILDETRVTNTVKNQTSFFECLTDVFNKLELQDRFFAPSSIEQMVDPPKKRCKKCAEENEDDPAPKRYCISHCIDCYMSPTVNCKYHDALYIKNKKKYYHCKKCTKSTECKKHSSIITATIPTKTTDEAYIEILKDTKQYDTLTKTKKIDYEHMFYLTQQYLPKASIINPFTIYWILNNIIPKGETFFTPVLSWSSYLMAFMQSKSYKHYVGVDVMKSVCKKTQFLGDYYKTLDKAKFGKKKYETMCCPSESLLKNTKFMKKYKGYFDTIMVCPPYFNMEIYKDGEQSLKNYPDYEDWLKQYWKQTIKVCHHVIKSTGTFIVIANDFQNLDKSICFLSHDLDNITKCYFNPRKNITKPNEDKMVPINEDYLYYLKNRESEMRMNKKDRIERLFIYNKKRTKDIITKPVKIDTSGRKLIKKKSKGD